MNNGLWSLWVTVCVFAVVAVIIGIGALVWQFVHPLAGVGAALFLLVWGGIWIEFSK